MTDESRVTKVSSRAVNQEFFRRDVQVINVPRFMRALDFEIIRRAIDRLESFKVFNLVLFIVFGFQDYF